MKGTYSQQISKHLREIREQRNLTQKQLADYIGADRSTYACYESGKVIPSIDIIMKLAEYLQVDYTELLASEELPNCFMDNSRNSFILTGEELRLLFAFRSMTDEEQKALLDSLKDPPVEPSPMIGTIKKPHFTWDPDNK